MTDYRDYIDIDKFVSNAKIGDGLPFINRFVCLLTKGTDKTEIHAFHVLSCDVPNFTIGVNEIELFGERRFNFTKREDSDLAITYLETPDLYLRSMFYEWMKLAVNITTDGTIIRQYPDKVHQNSIVKIFPLNNNGEAINCDKFEHLIPYDISGISYNYADTEIIKTTVKFKYKYHHLTTL